MKAQCHIMDVCMCVCTYFLPGAICWTSSRTRVEDKQLSPSGKSVLRNDLLNCCSRNWRRDRLLRCLPPGWAKPFERLGHGWIPLGFHLCEITVPLYCIALHPPPPPTPRACWCCTPAAHQYHQGLFCGQGGGGGTGGGGGDLVTPLIYSAASSWVWLQAAGPMSNLHQAAPC